MTEPMKWKQERFQSRVFRNWLVGSALLSINLVPYFVLFPNLFWDRDVVVIFLPRQLMMVSSRLLKHLVEVKRWKSYSVTTGSLFSSFWATERQNEVPKSVFVFVLFNGSRCSSANESEVGWDETIRGACIHTYVENKLRNDYIRKQGSKKGLGKERRTSKSFCIRKVFMTI